MKNYLDRIVPKYSDALRAGNQRYELRTARKKVEWAVSERQHAQALQNELRNANATLTVLMGLAAQ